MATTAILIIGAHGQLGSVLTGELQKIYGKQNIIATDIVPKTNVEGIFEHIDATDGKALERIVTKYAITEIYHLAAILSAKGEQYPLRTWEVNMNMTLHVFDVARKHKVDKVFFPSSIAVFGDHAPKENTPQWAPLNPTTVYGMSKAAGEHWAQYYFNTYGLDVRSLRYPGVVGYQPVSGGGTTDYAVEIYQSAVRQQPYTCFLKPDTKLPMIYMDDAIRATIELMQAPKENIKTRTSYNLGSMSFCPSEVAAAIQRTYPNFSMEYAPDFRQKISEKWPHSIDDGQARKDWGWKPKHDLESMTKLILAKLNKNMS